MADLFGKIRRGLRKPPRVIAERMFSMARTQTERFRLPRRIAMPEKRLLREFQATDLDSLWERLAGGPFPVWLGPCDKSEIDAICGPQECQEILKRAKAAIAHNVDLLGSGPTDLGPSIDWHTDFKTGLSWPPRYFADIEYNNPERPSDVKLPWELSRLQWLVPVGQAYLLDQDDQYAAVVRDVLEQWIASNPCGGSVNWTCTMEAALRVFTWVYFFKVFNGASSWSDKSFRYKFLRALYLHVEFTDRHIERSDINGNHYTADAAALAIGGLFFGDCAIAQRWHQEGWNILQEEMPRQIFLDGVDFEASVAYHRLVAELFLWPAMHRSLVGLPVPAKYCEMLKEMARFARTYSRLDGTVPLWGDADDARALPLGNQDINDHRYLTSLIGLYLDDPELGDESNTPSGELLWVFGPQNVRQWLAEPKPVQTSKAFPKGGFYVMRGGFDHIFIDCGPVGLAGRGGHGHNDCLSYEAVLDGVHLVTDCGAYVYTADFEERNLFRSTSLHNTPRIDGAEINRFIRPEYLWNLHNDAVPRVIEWSEVNDTHMLFCGEHSGYTRLAFPVTPRRAIVLDKVNHSLLVADQIVGSGKHKIDIPLHLSFGVEISDMAATHAILTTKGRRFRIEWRGTVGWSVTVEPARISPSYGCILDSKRLVWRQDYTELPCSLNVTISPAETPNLSAEMYSLVQPILETA